MEVVHPIMSPGVFDIPWRFSCLDVILIDDPTWFTSDVSLNQKNGERTCFWCDLFVILNLNQR